MNNYTNDSKPLVSLKALKDDLDVEVEVTPGLKESINQQDPEIERQLEAIEKKIQLKRKEIDYYDDRIYNLTNQGDSLDHALAAGAGVLAAFVDVLFVDGVTFKGGALNVKAVDARESLANTLSRSVDGKAEATDIFPLGNNLGENLIYGTINWFFTLIGNKPNGLPSPISGLVNSVSGSNSVNKLMAEKNIDGFKAYINQKTSNNTLSFTSGIDTLLLIGKQIVPVLVNECLVRAFYFIRRFFKEVSDKDVTSPSELYRVDWDNTVPFKNRTIVRMMTISTLVFSAVDIAAATVEGVVVSQGNINQFFNKFLLCVNFVGIGRALIACGTDLLMGVMAKRDRADRALLIDEMIRLENVKVQYKQKNVWVKAKSAEEVINESYSMMENAQRAFDEAYYGNKEDLKAIGAHASKIEDKNPGLKKEIKDIIDWE